MAQNKAVLNDEEFLFSHLSDYLDEEMNASGRQRFEEIANRLGKTDVSIDYGIRRGRLQIEAQRLFLDEEKMRHIHDLVEDDATRANHEAAEIEEVGASELKGNVIRFTTLAGFFTLFFGGLYLFFRPAPVAPFKALESLLYESLVLNENTEGRLAFPTDKLEELNQYFVKYPDLGFAPKVMKPLPEGWRVAGGSVIDYEVAKITVVQFTRENSEEKLYFYLYSGELKQLPKSPAGNADGLVYQTYANDKLNVIAWDAGEERVGMMIGSQGAPELASFASKVVGP